MGTDIKKKIALCAVVVAVVGTILASNLGGLTAFLGNVWPSWIGRLEDTHSAAPSENLWWSKLWPSWIGRD